MVYLSFALSSTISNGEVFNAQILIQGGPLLYSQVRQRLISGEASAEVLLPQVKGTYKPW